MSGKPATILSDSVRMPAASQAGDFHDVSGHHRYYGSSASNGGERLAETRRGRRPSFIRAAGPVLGDTEVPGHGLDAFLRPRLGDFGRLDRCRGGAAGTR